MVGVAISVAAGAADAQTTVSQDAGRSAILRAPGQARTATELRYQIRTMESVLENAVEHGASVWRDRLQALAPVQTMLLDNARVRGYRLAGYGVFFDIDVPSLEMTLFAALRTLDQNGLGVQSAWNTIKSRVLATDDPNLLQAVKRVELQLIPQGTISSVDVPNARTVSGQASVAAAPTATIEPDDPILANPEDAYRSEVMSALIDAMLDYSSPLGIGEDEWLWVGIRRNEVRPRGLDTNAQTYIARVRGKDLAAFRAGQLSREDAIKRVEVTVN